MEYDYSTLISTGSAAVPTESLHYHNAPWVGAPDCTELQTYQPETSMADCCQSNEVVVATVNQPGHLKKVEGGRWTLNDRMLDDWIGEECTFTEIVGRVEIRIIGEFRQVKSLSPGA